MIRIREISLPLEHDKTALFYHAAQALHIRSSDIATLDIFRRSLDARKKPDLRWVYTVDVTLRSGEGRVMRQNKNRKITREEHYHYQIHKITSSKRPVVVGFGPAGMFAALVLALSGARPVVLERGEAAPQRRKKVEEFWATGRLDPESNVQFGEGGAGTFSDGKLNTGTKNERSRWVLQQLFKAGAPENILYDAKPHVGTDILFHVVQSIREKIISLGGEVLFGSKFSSIKWENNTVCAVEYEKEGKRFVLPCEHLILAIGHSARDTFRSLQELGISMEAKPFSMGVRIEHSQQMIDRSQYAMSHGGAIPAADYKLSCHLPDGNSAYTFCMCPGGYVVAAASMEHGVVTNGMSYSDRNGTNANAALLVTLKPEDFPYEGSLGGLLWQEEIEKRAFVLGGRNYCAPAQRVEDFLAERPSLCAGEITPTYRPGVTFCNLHELYPEKICMTLRQAILALEEKLEGFSEPDAILTAPETRSSSPVRIVRDRDCQGSIKGLYPCGEGAGYAGGIMSAAVDGMLCAEAVLRSLSQ